MIKGLTRAGIGEVGSIENFVKLASQYGFGCLWTYNVGLLLDCFHWYTSEGTLSKSSVVFKKLFASAGLE